MASPSSASQLVADLVTRVRRINPARGALVALTTALALTACGGNAVTPSAVQTDAVAPTDTSISTTEPSSLSPDPTPTDQVAAGEPITGLKDAWTQDGYSYTLDINSMTPTVSVDTLRAKPGKADITVSFEVRGTLTNTTPQRIAPFPGTIAVEPLWRKGSPLCAGPLQSFSAFSSNDPGMSDRFCSLSGPGNLSGVSQEREIPLDGTVEIHSVVQNILTSDEASAPELQALLAAPEMWALGRADGQDVFTGCLLESGSVYLSVATGETGCLKVGS